MTITRIILGLVSILSIACGSSTSQVGMTADTSSTNAAPSQVSIDLKSKELFKLAQQAEDVSKVRIYTDTEGGIAKVAVYHNDDSKIPASMDKLKKEHFAQGKSVGYESELYADLGIVDEIKVETVDGKKCEVAGKKSGELLYVKCKIDESDLSESVRSAAAAAFPGGEFVEAEEKKVGERVTEYAVDFRYEGRLHRLYFSGAGEMTRHTVRVPATVDIPMPLPTN